MTGHLPALTRDAEMGTAALGVGLTLPASEDPQGLPRVRCMLATAQPKAVSPAPFLIPCSSRA